VDVHSQCFRTELPLLQLSGSEVDDRGTHLVVRTPTNPTYYWGNFLLLPSPPADADEVAHWVAEHRRELGAAHVSLGVDRIDGGDLAPLRDAGLEVEEPVAMTASTVHPPPRPNTDVELRRLGDGDWPQLVDLTLAGEEDDPHLTRDFIQRKVDSWEQLVRAGHGHWWGAFTGGDLVASLGIFGTGDGLARFQSVKTHPDHERRGICGTLVHRASQDAFASLGAETLVMVADPSDTAIRVYRSVGFTEVAAHAEATLLPTTT
jgi:ribosomal protein S18 acetylase RimI-like enzyme